MSHFEAHAPDSWLPSALSVPSAPEDLRTKGFRPNARDRAINAFLFTQQVPNIQAWLEECVSEFAEVTPHG